MEQMVIHFAGLPDLCGFAALLLLFEGRKIKKLTAMHL